MRTSAGSELQINKTRKNKTSQKEIRRKGQKKEAAARVPDRRDCINQIIQKAHVA
jgi:hypothetical protein